MRKVIVVALPIGLAILAGILLLTSKRAASDAAEAQLERARLKRDFDERAQVAKAIPTDRLPEWQAEVAALSRWYFGEMAAIRNRHPGEPPHPSALKAAEEDRKGKLKKEEKEAILDFQAYADGRLALLKEARYAPVASMAAEGLRLDLVAIDSGPVPGAGPGLRIDFALWGAPRYLERETSRDKVVLKNVIPISFKHLALHFLDGTGKLYGEMTGPGEPYQKLVDPERFIDEFPPGVLFGTWWVELFPREAATVEFDLDGDLRAPSGAIRPLSFKARLPVPERWKLPPGAAFQAEVREAAPAQ